MVFVKSHLPSRKLNDFKIPFNIQIILFEKNFRKKCLFFLVFDKSIELGMKKLSFLVIVT